MRKPVRIIAAIAGVLLMAVAAVGFMFYRASQRAPEFYVRALAQDAETNERGSDEFLQQATAVASDATQLGKWQVLFTAEQINGWLAVDVPKNYPKALPSHIELPLVALERNAATIAAKFYTTGVGTIASLSVDVFVSAPNEVAVRFKSARLGSMPMPLGRILEPIQRAAEDADLAVIWRQQDGDPVAVFLLPDSGNKSRRIRLETISLRDGAVLIAGRTTDGKTVGSPDSDEPKPPKPIAQDDAEETPRSAAAANENRQR